MKMETRLGMWLLARARGSLLVFLPNPRTGRSWAAKSLTRTDPPRGWPRNTATTTRRTGHSLYFQRAQWRHVFLFFANIAVFSCWRHMQKQYILMALPRPQTVVIDVEAVVREYLGNTATTAPLKDLPPKYEDVEDSPPQYDEHTMIMPEDEDHTPGDRAPEQNTN